MSTYQLYRTCALERIKVVRAANQFSMWRCWGGHAFDFTFLHPHLFVIEVSTLEHNAAFLPSFLHLPHLDKRTAFQQGTFSLEPKLAELVPWALATLSEKVGHSGNSEQFFVWYFDMFPVQHFGAISWHFRLWSTSVVLLYFLERISSEFVCFKVGRSFTVSLCHQLVASQKPWGWKVLPATGKLHKIQMAIALFSYPPFCDRPTLQFKRTCDRPWVFPLFYWCLPKFCLRDSASLFESHEVSVTAYCMNW